MIFSINYCIRIRYMYIYIVNSTNINKMNTISCFSWINTNCDTMNQIFIYRLVLVRFEKFKFSMFFENILCPPPRQDCRHSAVALLLKEALIQVSDYRLLGASGLDIQSNLPMWSPLLSSHLY
jgi:hypothetical protein